MHTSPTIASTPLPNTNYGPTRTRRLEDVVYQTVTVAAILLVLCSIWVF